MRKKRAQSATSISLPSLPRRSRNENPSHRPSSEPCKLPPLVDNNAKLKQELNDYLKNLNERNLIRLTSSREIERAVSVSSSASSSPLTSPRDFHKEKEEKEENIIAVERDTSSSLFLTQCKSPSLPEKSNEDVRKQIEDIDKRLSELSNSSIPLKETNNTDEHQRT